MGSVSVRYAALRRSVGDAADTAGLNSQVVTVVAVTKMVGIAEIREAISAGILDFGENRVQEFLGKYGLFPDVRWHFIGSLQTNKVKDVVGRAYLIHSVDSVRLLGAIERRAAGVGVVQPVLLQVNVSGEPSKHGFDPFDVRDALVAAAGCKHVAVRGLMTMAPLGDETEARTVFRGLREVRDSLRALRLDGVELDELSMGMSGDYRVAVEEGATMVRVGRAIFG